LHLLTEAMAIPCVVIAGRPNVGKSSLFNAISGGRVAIVEPTPGVTRDRISRIVERDGRRFELVDTGGLGLVDELELSNDIHRQIEVAIAHADIVLLVVDVKAGRQPMDEEISRRLRQAGKRVLLVINKCDTRKDEQGVADFYALGQPDMVPTSVEHRRGIRDLMQVLHEALPEPTGEPAEAVGPTGPGAAPVKIAFVGRRNAGKSTLVNYLAQEPRVLVSEIPGTTRDSVDVDFRVGEMRFTAIDTAGVRRRKQVKDSIDLYSDSRVRGAIGRADVVVHLLDGPMEIGRLDKQLADYVVSRCKPCVVAVNKVDLAPGTTLDEWDKYVRDRLPGVAFAPLVCISAQTGQNVMTLIETAVSLHEQSFVRVATGELNRAIEEAVVRRPPPSSNTQFGRIYYATQVAVKPPTVVLFANEPDLIDDNYQRYLAGRLRGAFGFSAIPIRFVVRPRRREDED
jgi:GTP-binding protein